MKYFFLLAGLLVPALAIGAQDNSAKKVNGSGASAPPAKPLFTWDLLWAGSWEESKTLHNRGNVRLGLTPPGLFLRGQVLDRHQMNFELDPPWGKPPKGITNASVGLYHKATGSRLLYGTLDEWGLPARIRSPWIRSAPYSENHQPIMADLKTVTSSTKKDEMYLYVSSPRFELPVMRIRGFSSAQFVVKDAVERHFTPAFSGGLETSFGKKYSLLMEGFYTGAELPAKKGSAWFSDPPPLPVRDFRLGAAALMLNTPYVSFASDWAWSETFAFGKGVYGNGGVRVSPPLSKKTSGKPGPLSLSLAVDGMSERYVGRDGSSPGGGLRTAGKVEWAGPRSSLLRVNTTVCAPAIKDEPFNRSSTGVYYRFPALTAREKSKGTFPLRVTRISLNADRNATNLKKIQDGIDAKLGLSVNLPPILLPPGLLPSSKGSAASARKVKNPKAKSYPLNINLSSSINMLGSSPDEAPAPYPFSSVNQEFDSAKTSCEFLWPLGIFQFRTKWGYTAYAKKDNHWDSSVGVAARFKYGRVSVKFAWPVFPEKWNVTLSWRVEK